MKDVPDIVTYFSEVEDPRIVGRSKHLLIDIIIITIAAIVAGAEGWEEIEDYATRKKSLFEKFLRLPSGIPSHDTLRRVMGLVRPDSIRPAFTNWATSLAKSKAGDVIAVDGKTARRSGSPANGTKPAHIVSAWSCGTGLVIGQTQCDEKSNEITAVPELLEMLELKGKIVTTDALNTQKTIAAQVRKAGGDYVFALKSNAGNLHGECVRLFERCKAKRWRGVEYDWYKTEESGHGRREVRKYWTIPDEFSGEWFRGYVFKKDTWPDLRTLGVVESTRTVGGKTSKETRYYLSSLGNDAEQLGRAVRGHWGVENNLHWMLDVVYREDNDRNRTAHAQHNLSVCRKVALNLTKLAKDITGSIKRTRRAAGWDDSVLLQILGLSV